MTREIKKVAIVTLEPIEFVIMLSTVKTIKQAAIHNKDEDEASYMQELIDKLLDYSHTNDDHVQLELDVEKRFALWLALDKYCDFCNQFKYVDEKVKAQRIMNKLR